MTKPFSPGELIARLHAALRRAPQDGGEAIVSVDGLEIDLAAHRVRRDGEEIHLTPIEFDLLRVLAVNRGRLLTHRMLLAEVWGPQYADDTQTLRVHVGRLRAKIEPPSTTDRASSVPTLGRATASPAEQRSVTKSLQGRRESLGGRYARQTKIVAWMRSPSSLRSRSSQFSSS